MLQLGWTLTSLDIFRFPSLGGIQQAVAGRPPSTMMGFYPEEKPKREEVWVEYKDFNPDRQRSSSGMIVEPDDKGNYRWVLLVKGLGAIVMRASANPDTGRLEFQGISEFTDAEVGWRK